MADALPISGLTLKTTPADSADIFPIYDSLTGTTKGIQGAQLMAGIGGSQTIKVSLTSAQLLNSFTAPITLISAPGAGKIISIIDCVFQYNYGTATYVNPNACGIYTTTINFSQIAFGAGFLTSATSLLGKVNSSGSASTNVFAVNQGVEFATFTANPTTGDGTLDLYISYNIITL